MKFEAVDPNSDVFHNVYIPNNTETRALLSVEQSRFEIYFQRLYHSPNCQYFYLALMIVSILMVVLTVIEGI